MKSYSGEELEKKILERMNDHPLGWKYFYTENKRGQFSIGFVNLLANEQYWLKFPSPYSFRAIGFEAAIDEKLPFLEDPFFDRDFGFRPLKITEEERGKMEESGRIVYSVLKKIRKATREKPEPFQEDSIVGPFPSFVISDLGDISPAQRELEMKMEEEIERLQKRYMTYVA